VRASRQLVDAGNWDRKEKGPEDQGRRAPPRLPPHAESDREVAADGIVGEREAGEAARRGRAARGVGGRRLVVEQVLDVEEELALAQSLVLDLVGEVDGGLAVGAIESSPFRKVTVGSPEIFRSLRQRCIRSIRRNP
jgi:hypothetical protein